MKRILLLALATTFISLPALAAPGQRGGSNPSGYLPYHCQTALDSERLFDMPRVHAKDWNMSEHPNDYFPVGNGAAGTVMAVREPGHDFPTYTEKKYQFLNSLERDHRLMLGLRQLTEEASVNFNVLEVLGVSTTLGNYTMKLQYIEGRTVHDLLNDESVDADLREEIAEAFNLLVTNIFIVFPFERYQMEYRNIESHETMDYFRDNTPDGTDVHIWHGMNTEDPIMMIIKSDNVLVKPTRDSEGRLQLWLIDPH